MQKIKLFLLCSFFGAFYIIAFYSSAFIISKALFSVVLGSIPHIGKIVLLLYSIVVGYLYHKEKRIELGSSSNGKNWRSSR